MANVLDPLLLAPSVGGALEGLDSDSPIADAPSKKREPFLIFVHKLETGLDLYLERKLWEESKGKLGRRQN